ncbi:MAG: hypothetical protein J6D08_18500 [Lachnospiraceae bacterium]|nr:hypothetical protein [Lachnospiraceae bacterium]
MTKEGFYFYRNNVYFGCFDEKQVSGQARISVIKPKHIQTDHPICEDDWAVRL